MNEKKTMSEMKTEELIKGLESLIAGFQIQQRELQSMPIVNPADTIMMVLYYIMGIKLLQEAINRLRVCDEKHDKG